MTRSQMLRIGLLAAIVLAGCAPSAPAAGGAVPAPTNDTMVKPTDVSMTKPTESAMARPTQDAMAKPAGTPSGDAMMSQSPAWFDTALTDVNSGKTFKLSDFTGQIVLVEGIAVWCTNCLRQQRELVKLHQQIGDQALSVAIDVDLNEDAALLKQHATTNGFTWRYTVGTPELVKAFADQFGNQFLNPPSVPMFLIDKQGEVHLLDFGHKTVDYLTAQIQSFQ